VRAQPLDGGNLLPYNTNGVFCIGCHTGTPDGKYVAFTAQWPYPDTLATVQPEAGPGLAPPWLTIGAASNLSPNINGYYAPPTVAQVMMGIPTFSPAHYGSSDRILVSSIGSSWNSTSLTDPGRATGVVSQLAWFDLQYTGAVPTGMAYNPWQPGSLTSPLPLATPCTGACAQSANPTGGWGIVQRNGDSNSAGAPSWSHDADGNTDVIAYASTNLGTRDGRMDCAGAGPTCTSDIFLVPYAGGSGGAATPLPGAADAAYSEYYPAWSPDDQWIAFNRVPTGTSMYNEPAAEVYVVPYQGGNGGVATRLRANDPAACTGHASPGVQNTWPKWAPNPLVNGAPASEKDADGNTYYWLIFSSTRRPGNREQLYVAGLMQDTAGAIHSYPAIRVPSQSYLVNNLIPSWGDFSIGPGTTLPPK
jgi:hypothetical protein